MAWVLLIAAGVLEVGFALALKASDGFARLWPTATFIVLGIASFTLLSMALRTLPVGTAYAVWTGIGAAGTVVVGILALGESTSVVRLTCVGLIVAAVIGLQLTEASA